MLLSESDEDFELGKTLLEGLGIKPSCLLNYNTKASNRFKFKFKMEAGELKRWEPQPIFYEWSTYHLGVDSVGNIIETP